MLWENLYYFFANHKIQNNDVNEYLLKVLYSNESSLKMFYDLE